MHPDRKIGIALGILLVGVVGALFFRNEPLPVEQTLSEERARQLNEQLRVHDVHLYSETSEAAEPSLAEDDASARLEALLQQRRRKRKPAEPPVAIGNGGLVGDGETIPKPRIVGSTKSPATANDGSTETLYSATDSSTTLPGTTEQQPAAAHDQVDIPRPEFEEYTVQYGDTLSDIAERFLGSSARFREIYEANKDRMNSPDHLRVGKSIRIPRQRL